MRGYTPSDVAARGAAHAVSRESAPSARRVEDVGPSIHRRRRRRRHHHYQLACPPLLLRHALTHA